MFTSYHSYKFSSEKTTGILSWLLDFSYIGIIYMRLMTSDVSKAIVNHLYVHGLYHPFRVKLGMVDPIALRTLLCVNNDQPGTPSVHLQ